MKFGRQEKRNRPRSLRERESAPSPWACWSRKMRLGGMVVTPKSKNKDNIPNGKKYREVAWGSETAKSGNCPNMQANCR